MAAGAAAWKGWRHKLLVDAAIPCDPQPLGDRPPSKILTACVFSIRLQQKQQQQLQQQPTPKVTRWELLARRPAVPAVTPTGWDTLCPTIVSESRLEISKLVSMHMHAFTDGFSG